METNFWQVDLRSSTPVKPFQWTGMRNAIVAECNDSNCPEDLMDELLSCVAFDEDGHLVVTGTNDWRRSDPRMFSMILNFMHARITFAPNELEWVEVPTESGSMTFEFGSETYWVTEDLEDQSFACFILVQAGRLEQEVTYYDTLD